MSERFGMARRASQLILVMAAVSGNAMASSAASTVSSAGTPPAASAALKRQEASLQPSSGVARPFAAFGVTGHRSPFFASERTIPVRKAKIYALALSSFGMLGMIALHRLADIV